MKANYVPGYDKERVFLKDVIPISVPYTLFISPSQLCNFKCHYCAHSLPGKVKKDSGLIRVHMQDDCFEKIIDQSKALGGKYKRVLLTGLGEPLLNQDVASMVRRISSAQISDRIEIFTNASKLNKSVSDDLISSGLTKLRISIQGTSKEAYKKHAKINLDFNGLVDNIAYFFKTSRNRCSVYIKVINEELDSESDRQKFLDIFGEICDEIYVENLVRAQPMMGDYDNKISSERTFYGEEAKKRDVCPYIFYTLQIDSEGFCYPCPPLSLPKSFSLGNINQESISEIWYGRKHMELMQQHLLKDGSRPDLCKNCTCYKAFTPEQDNLDDSAASIKKRLSNV